MRLICLCVAMIITGCAAAAPEPPPAAPIPEVVGTCPAPAPDPVAPPRILSVERLRLFAQQTDAARVHDKAALRECSMRLHRAMDVLNAARAAQGVTTP
jgi:hypothetical protein